MLFDVNVSLDERLSVTYFAVASHPPKRWHEPWLISNHEMGFAYQCALTISGFCWPRRVSSCEHYGCGWCFFLTIQLNLRWSDSNTFTRFSTPLCHSWVGLGGLSLLIKKLSAVFVLSLLQAFPASSPPRTLFQSSKADETLNFSNLFQLKIVKKGLKLNCPNGMLKLWYYSTKSPSPHTYGWKWSLFWKFPKELQVRCIYSISSLKLMWPLTVGLQDYWNMLIATYTNTTRWRKASCYLSNSPTPETKSGSSSFNQISEALKTFWPKTLKLLGVSKGH